MTAVVQWLWQGTLLAVALATVLRHLPRVNAATRYVLWWLALAVVFALPLIDAWVLPALVDRFGAIFAATASRATALSAPSVSMVDGAMQLAVNGVTSTTALFTAPALPDWFVAAVAGVVVFRSLKLPPMLGYLVVGVLIGPDGAVRNRTPKAFLWHFDSEWFAPGADCCVDEGARGL